MKAPLSETRKLMRKRHTFYDPTLDSTQHLLWLGTQNQRWNQDAREILAGRGETSVFLREYEKCLKSSHRGDSQLTRVNREGIKPNSWLAPTPTGKCCDCGKITTRTYNNGKVWQCGTCADGVKSVGRKEWKERLKAKKRRLLKKTTPEPEQPKVVEPSEIIPAREPSFEKALKSGADSETVKAIGNQEAAQAAYDAYANTKDSLSQLMDSMERAA